MSVSPALSTKLEASGATVKMVSPCFVTPGFTCSRNMSLFRGTYSEVSVSDSNLRPWPSMRVSDAVSSVTDSLVPLVKSKSTITKLPCFLPPNEDLSSVTCRALVTVHSTLPAFTGSPMETGFFFVAPGCLLATSSLPEPEGPPPPPPPTTTAMHPTNKTNTRASPAPHPIKTLLVVERPRGGGRSLLRRRRRLLPGLLRRRRHGYVCFRCRDARRLVYRSTA